MPDDFGLKLGMGCLMSVLLFAAKCLVAWCTGDSELAMSTIDLGYLLFVGPFAIFACMTPIRALHQFLTESLTAHIIVGEVLANTLALPLIDPKTNFKMGPDMWVHHITSAFSGIYVSGEAPRPLTSPRLTRSPSPAVPVHRHDVPAVPQVGLHAGHLRGHHGASHLVPAGAEERPAARPPVAVLRLHNAPRVPLAHELYGLRLVLLPQVNLAPTMPLPLRLSPGARRSSAGFSRSRLRQTDRLTKFTSGSW